MSGIVNEIHYDICEHPSIETPPKMLQRIIQVRIQSIIKASVAP